MNLPCQIFLLCKVLDFVESKILVWRAEVDLVMIFFVPDLGTLYRIGGSSTPPNCKGDMNTVVMKFNVTSGCENRHPNMAIVKKDRRVAFEVCLRVDAINGNAFALNS